MSDERPEERPEDAAAETSSRPPPRNPFASPEERSEEGDVPALIEGRRSAAIYGVFFGLLMLVLVVGLCVATSYAFG